MQITESKTYPLEFRSSKTSNILTSIVFGVIILAIVGVWIYIYTSEEFWENNSSIEILLVNCFFSTILIVISLLLTREFKKRYLLYEDKFVFRGLFFSKTIHFSEYENFTSLSQPSYLAFTKGSKTSCSIEYYIENKDLFESELSQFLAPAKDYIVGTVEIDPEIYKKLGSTKEEQDKKYNRIKRFTTFFPILLFMSLVFIRFFTSQSTHLGAVLIIIPFLLLFIFSKYQDLFTTDNTKRTQYLQFSRLFIPGSIFPALLISMHDIEWSKDILFPVLIIAILYTAIHTFTLKRIRDKVFIVILCSIFYSFGSTIYLNCVFDPFPEEIETAVVSDKLFNENDECSNFQLILTPISWTGETHLGVSEQIFVSFDVGDTVSKNLGQGLFGIRYEKSTNQR